MPWNSISWAHARRIAITSRALPRPSPSIRCGVGTVRRCSARPMGDSIRRKVELVSRSFSAIKSLTYVSKSRPCENFEPPFRSKSFEVVTGRPPGPISERRVPSHYEMKQLII